MRTKNSLVINYLKKNEEFADIANMVLFQGNSVIKTEHLSELDTSESIYIAKSNSNIKKTKSIQRYRDVIKSVTINEKDNYTIRLIVGNEAQSEIHYAMPVRNMVYDALNYATQVKELTEINHKKKNYSNSQEFLSGLTKNDRLIPVITIVIFFGNSKWDGPLSLHQMLDLDGIPKSLKDKIPDYKIMVISPDLLEESDLEKMTSTAGYVLGAIKYSKNKEELNCYIEENKDVFEHFPAYAAAVVNEYCKLEVKKEDIRKGEVNMCQAVIEIREEGKMEGIREGIREGIERMISNALLNQHSPEEIAEFMGVDLEEVFAVQKKLQKL